MVTRQIRKNIETSWDDAYWYFKMGMKSMEEGSPNRVTISLFCQALIRGTDCLCFYYNKESCQSGRGHGLHKPFQKLYTRKGMPEKYSQYTSTLKKWVAQEKDLAQYKGKNYGNKELGKAEKQTKRYLENCVKSVLEEENIWNDLNISYS
jgi:hypothetical protein